MFNRIFSWLCGLMPVYGPPMSAPPKDSTSGQVDEGQAVRIEKLQADIELLKAQMADLGAAFKSNVTHNSDHFKSIYQYLADIHDQLLWPLVHKVFPGSAATQSQIATAIKSGGKSCKEGEPE